MIFCLISYVNSCREQGCVVVLAPYPNNPNPVESFNLKTDFDLTGDGLVWYERPQLFFNCTLCPTGAKWSVYSGSHKEVSLVYFSTFEPIDLTPGSIMQRAGVPMINDSAINPRLPCFYICPCWRAPPHSVLHLRQQSHHYPILLQGRLAWMGRRCTVYPKVQGSSLLNPHMMYGVLVFFPEQIIFLIWTMIS